jgi:branched-chain amino acid transport system ATP-binding protein
MYAVETQELRKDFAGFRAVDGVDLRLEADRVHALVGPNGAGKTSLFNLLTGFLRPTSGRVLLFGENVTGWRPDEIAKRGVARSFQITSLFEDLTVIEHVALALQSRTALGYGFWRDGAVLRRFEDVHRTIALVARLREGRTIVLVEHNMGVVGKLADNVVVLQQGKVIAEGPYDTVRADPAVIAAYLGQVDA